MYFTTLCACTSILNRPFLFCHPPLFLDSLAFAMSYSDLFSCHQLVCSIEDLKQSVEERASAVRNSEEGAADLKKKVEELSKSLEEHEKDYQVRSTYSCQSYKFYPISTGQL